jgi:hypothetical protein
MGTSAAVPDQHGKAVRVAPLSARRRLGHLPGNKKRKTLFVALAFPKPSGMREPKDGELGNRTLDLLKSYAQACK